MEVNLLEAKPQKKRYVSKVDTLDRDRGDCLMLYNDLVDLLEVLEDDDWTAALKAIFAWFLGADENAMWKGPLTEGASKTAQKIAKLVIERQKRSAGRYIERCEKQRQRRLARRPTCGLVDQESNQTTSSISRLIETVERKPRSTKHNQTITQLQTEAEMESVLNYRNGEYNKTQPSI